MFKRLWAVILPVALVVGLSAAVTSSAHAATTNHTVAQVEAYAKGKYYGPTSFSGFGRATITSYSSYVSCTDRKTYYGAGLTMARYPNPTQVKGVRSSATLLAKPGATCEATPGMLPMSSDWWNPFSWDWGHILGSTWNTLWNNCVKGAASGVVGTASGTLIINLLIKAAKVFIGPEGYAALAIGGCVVDLLF